MAANHTRRTIARVWPYAILLVLAAFVWWPTTSSLGKDLELTGTVDCGLASGARCSIGDTLRLWTTDVDGTRRLVEIDVSWIRDQLGGIDQDDLMSFEVRDLGGGHFQAIAVHDLQPDPHKPFVEDDHDNGGVLPPATATATPTATPTGTRTPTLTPTATPTLTPVPPPGVSISNGVVDDPRSPTVVHFTITLSSPSALVVSVQFSTSNGTATEGVDYQGVHNLPVVFSPGSTSQVVDVSVGPNECPSGTFFGNIASAVNATITRPQGIATIPQPCS